VELAQQYANEMSAGAGEAAAGADEAGAVPIAATWARCELCVVGKMWAALPLPSPTQQARLARLRDASVLHSFKWLCGRLQRLLMVFRLLQHAAIAGGGRGLAGHSSTRTKPSVMDSARQRAAAGAGSSSAAGNLAAIVSCTLVTRWRVRHRAEELRHGHCIGRSTRATARLQVP
jgi:hypothetical protein